MWIQTYTGRQFYPFEPNTADVDVRDIAHALSLLCRFNGHCATFYSVAEHAVRVSAILPPELARWGLLHDAAEAYLSDIPRPLKRQWPEFQALEDRLLRVLAGVFDLAWPMPDAVVAADNCLLATEARDLMGTPPAAWQLDAEPLPERIVPRGPVEAEALFLETYARLRA